MQKRFNVCEQTAFQDSDCLVIDGEQVAKILAREEGLPEKHKGTIL